MASGSADGFCLECGEPLNTNDPDDAEKVDENGVDGWKHPWCQRN